MCNRYVIVTVICTLQVLRFRRMYLMTTIFILATGNLPDVPSIDTFSFAVRRVSYILVFFSIKLDLTCKQTDVRFLELLSDNIEMPLSVLIV